MASAFPKHPRQRADTVGGFAMSTASPFDEPSGTAAALDTNRHDPATVRRERYAQLRKRSLIGGMVLLLLLTWLRELTGLPTEVIWTLAGCVLVMIVAVYANTNEEARLERLRRHRLKIRDHKRRQVELLAAALADEAWGAEHRCPDCSAEMRRIRICDSSDGGLLRYTGLQDSGWPNAEDTGTRGVVQGHICTRCFRIVLRGVPIGGSP